jgi:undecaprenyl-diphosphatase
VNWLDALILGLVQGLTEFLPISSTAHVVLAEQWLGLKFSGYSLEIFLHIASALALVAYYRKDFLDLSLRSVRFIKSRNIDDKPYFYFVVFILFTTFITGIIGITLKETVNTALKSFTTIGVSFIFTALALVIAERLTRVNGRDLHQMKWSDAAAMGLIQALAIIPGISRSGATLAGGLLLGLNKETAVRFSFFLAVPVIFGSLVVGLKDMSVEEIQAAGFAPLALSFVTTFVASLVGIVWLINFVRKQRLVYFAGYCFILGVVLLFLGGSGA